MLLVGNGRERVMGLEFGEMEENELEEGEALSSGEASIDPDVDFPYIDEKLEEVLGDIREGGVFDENMGARFNGYGSFLPLYQRTPSFHSQTKTPPKESTRNGIRSPFKPQHEVARISPSSQTRMTVMKSNNKIVLGSQSLPKSGKKEEKASGCIGTESGHESKTSFGGDNNVDHKRLKVRIKVGSDNTTKRDNAAIYSGLGLVISPSSSPEDNHDAHEGSSPEFGGASNETPRTILQIMTCCPIPEEHILSPLHYSLLGLTEKGSAYFSDVKARPVQKSVSEGSANYAWHVKDVEESETKIIMMAEDNRRLSVDVRKLHPKDDTTMIKKDIHIDAPEEVVSNELNTVSSAGSTGIEERNKSTKNADLSRTKCIDNVVIASKRSSTTNNVESRWSKEANGIAHAEDQTRTSMIEEKLENGMSNLITESCSLLCEDSGHAREADDFGQTSCEMYKTKTSNSIKTPKASRQKHDKRASSCVHAEERTGHEDDQLLEAPKRSKGNTDLPTDCCTGEDAAPAHMQSLTKGKGSPARSEHSGKRSKSKKRLKEQDRSLREEPYSMVEGVKAEQVDDKLTLLDTNHRYNLTDVKRENEKSKHESVKKSESSVLAEQPMQLPAIPDIAALDGGSTSNDQYPLDDWVQCDRCQKWRLLPSGTSTESLPSKWHCKMLNWLPGMNMCSISEDETSKALYALYSRPVPDSGTILNGHPNVASSIITSIDGDHSCRKNEAALQNGPRIGKKKKHAASLPCRSTPNRSFAVKTEERSMNSGKVDSLSQTSQELTTLSKVDIEGSKSLKVTSEAAAHKQLKQQTDKGDFFKGSGKTLRSTSKRRVDGDGTLLFKKMKVAERCNSDSDAYGKLVLSTDDHLPAKLSHTNAQKNCSSSKYLMSKLHDDNPSSKKSTHQAFCGRDLKENCEGADISNCDELSLKKRKTKHKDGSRCSIGEHVNFKEDVRDSGSRKEKAKLLKPDGKSRSTADNRVNKVGRAAASEDHNKKIVGRDVDDGKLHKIALQDNASHQHGEHDVISSKTGIGNPRPLTMGPESNSSSYGGGNEEAVACRSVNFLSQGALDTIEKFEIAPARRSQALPSTSDSQQVTTSAVKESRSTVNHLDAADGVRLGVSKDQITLDAQNAGASNSSRHTGPSDSKAVAGTPFRKDFPPANAIFKEARELKHMANRIKTDGSGSELESTTMYFQAALKFLHGASLLEPSNLDGDRHGELTQSLQMYLETAKLLEFCAHEYEKCKEMAAAALAYKCMEVAYFKIAYYRHPVANKDRQECQATVLMHSLGESPSSSVSDLDNLYNGCLVDKSALVKGANSPQAAGTRAIAARSSSLMRLLDYMNETMFAFEASRKSHNAIAAANARLDKYGNDGLASVRTVLDLSFHNVQELLRLVRLSIESIHL